MLLWGSFDVSADWLRWMDTESQVSGQIGGYYSTEYHLPQGQVSRAQAVRFCFEGWIFTVKRIKHQRNKKQGWFRLIQKPQDYSSFLLKSLLSQCIVCQLIQLFIRALSVVTIFSEKKKNQTLSNWSSFVLLVNLERKYLYSPKPQVEGELREALPSIIYPTYFPS